MSRLKKTLVQLRERLLGRPPIHWNRITQDDLKRHLGKDDPVIIEIGANNGTETEWFLDAFPNATIYCFEPDPRAIDLFKTRLGNHSNVQLFEAVLSDKEGIIQFFPSGGNKNSSSIQDWHKSGSIRKPKDHLKKHPWVTFSDPIEVRSRTLDAWWKENECPVIDFIWMDVQGAEMDVFRGGAEALKATKFIYTEYSNSELYEGQANLNTILRHLKDFELVTRYRADVLVKNKHLP